MYQQSVKSLYKLNLITLVLGFLLIISALLLGDSQLIFSVTGTTVACIIFSLILRSELGLPKALKELGFSWEPKKVIVKTKNYFSNLPLRYEVNGQVHIPQDPYYKTYGAFNIVWDIGNPNIVLVNLARGNKWVMFEK